MSFFEKPPPGYKKSDRPLHHHIYYWGALAAFVVNVDGTMLPLIRSSADAVNPNTIEVRTNNSSFAEETGSVCCVDSMVTQMTITKKLVFSEHSHHVDKLPALKVKEWFIQNNSDTEMDKADDLTTTTVKSILKLTKDATKKDVTPTYNNVNQGVVQTLPLSTVTMAEAFGDLNLTGSAASECCVVDLDLLKTARRYYTNKRAINNIMGKEQTTILTPHKTYVTETQTRFIPKPIQTIKDYTFFAKHIQVPKHETEGAINGRSTVPTLSINLDYEYIIDYNEWNTEFIQTKI